MSKAAEALAEALLQRRRELVGENPSITVAEVERALASLIDSHPDVQRLIAAAIEMDEFVGETTSVNGWHMNGDPVRWEQVEQAQALSAALSNWLPSPEKSDE